MKKSKAAAVILALMFVGLFLTGCTATQQPQKEGEPAESATVTIYETDTLKIESEGAKTRIYDLKGNAVYTFTAHKQRVPAASAAQIVEAKTTTDTETVKIQTAYNLIIVTEKATGKTLYIR